MKMFGLVMAALMAVAAAAPSAMAAKFDAKAAYASTCAGCHGATGAGGFGPALSAVDKKGDKYISDIISKGKAPKMPAFAQFKGAELKALTTYVKSL